MNVKIIIIFAREVINLEYVPQQHQTKRAEEGYFFRQTKGPKELSLKGEGPGFIRASFSITKPRF